MLHDSSFMLTKVTSNKYSNVLRVLERFVFSSIIKANIAKDVLFT
jgi:hypothetical protein